MVCLRCGAQNKEGGRYCSNCGAELSFKDNLTQGQYSPQIPQAANEARHSQQMSQDTNEVRYSNQMPQDTNGVRYSNQMPQDTNEIRYSNQMPPDTNGVKYSNQMPQDTNGVRYSNQLPQNANEVRYQPSKKLKSGILISAIAILALVLIVIVFLRGKVLLTNGESPFFNLNNQVIEVDSNQSTIFFYNTKGELIDELESQSYTEFSSMDDLVKAVLTDKGDLYYINKYGAAKVDSDVVGFNITDSGNGIIYEYAEDNSHILAYFDISKEDKDVLDEGGIYYDYIISPDGKTILFVKTDDMGEDASYIVKNGKKSEWLTESTQLIGVSNDAKYIYYYQFDENNNASVWVLNGKNSVELTDLYVDYIFFNKDYSEIMFTSEGSTYISIKGNEKQEVIDENIVYIIKSKMCAETKDYTLAIDSFKNKVVVSENNELGFINEKYKGSMISSSVSNAHISEDGNSLIYLEDSGNICYIKDLKGGYKEKILVDNLDVCYYVANLDLTEIHILTYSGELYYMKINKEPKLIAEDVYDVYISADGKNVFFLSSYENDSGTVYYSQNGEKGTEVKNGSGVYSMDLRTYGIVFNKPSDEGYEYYYNGNGTEFKLIYEGAGY